MRSLVNSVKVLFLLSLRISSAYGGWPYYSQYQGACSGLNCQSAYPSNYYQGYNNQNLFQQSPYYPNSNNNIGQYWNFPLSNQQARKPEIARPYNYFLVPGYGQHQGYINHGYQQPYYQPSNQQPYYQRNNQQPNIPQYSRAPYPQYRKPFNNQLDKFDYYSDLGSPPPEFGLPRSYNLFRKPPMNNYYPGNQFWPGSQNLFQTYWPPKR